jgi:hypothetical protein
MSAPRRWIRLDIGWEKSDWVADLTPASKLCWILLLGYVKAFGVCGSVRAMTHKGAAREFGVSESDFTAMLSAGVADGAIEATDKSWSILGWDFYQNEGNAERQRRYRADRSRLSPLRDITDSNAVKRNVTDSTGETLTLTVTETKKKTTKTAARVDYTDDFNSLWKIHPRGPKSDAYREYLKAVPSRLSHDDLKACYHRYVLTEINDKFRGWDTFRWIRDGRWEEYMTTNGNAKQAFNGKSHSNPMGLRDL